MTGAIDENYKKSMVALYAQMGKLSDEEHLAMVTLIYGVIALGGTVNRETLIEMVPTARQLVAG